MINKVILIGNVGKDAVLRYTPSKIPTISFPLATSESWKGKDGTWQKKTEWHKIVMWGKPAEYYSTSLTAGKLVYVEGRLQTRNWENEDGKKVYVTEIISAEIKLLSKQENLQPELQETKEINQNYRIETNANFTEDEIPF